MRGESPGCGAAMGTGDGGWRLAPACANAEVGIIHALTTRSNCANARRRPHQPTAATAYRDSESAEQRRMGTGEREGREASHEAIKVRTRLG